MSGMDGIKIVLLAGGLASLAGTAAGEYKFGDGNLVISESEVVDVLVDGDGAEFGAGVAGGGAMVSGEGNSSTIDSSKASLQGGTIYGILTGGSYAKDGASATVSGDSFAEMTSGNINYKSDISPYDPTILGGGFAHSLGDLGATSVVKGNSTVSISGGYSVYAAAGGASQSDGSGSSYSEVAGKSLLEMTGGEVWGLYGGGWSLGSNAQTKSWGGSQLLLTGGYAEGNILGGGGAWNGGKSYLENGSLVVVDGMRVNGSVLGGGEAYGGSVATVVGGTDVQIKSGFANYVYGGGADWDESARNSDVSVDSAKVSITGGEVGRYVVGGGYYADVKGLANVNISGGSVGGNVYGAGEGISSVGSTLVEISGGSISGKVFGGGKGANSTVNYGTSVSISGAVSLSDVYGGGENGSVTKGSAQVEISGGAAANNIYAGGFASGGTATKIEGGANVDILGGSLIKNNLYGGGYSADANSVSQIGSDVVLTVSNSTINGDIYTGGYGAGSSIKGSSAVVFVGAGEGITFNGTVYGGGENGAVVEGNSILAFGDEEQSFNGVFEGKISNMDILVVSEQSSVDFTNAFDVSTLMVSYDSSLALAADSSFDKFSLVFSSDFSEGDAIDFGQIFKDAQTQELVLGLLESSDTTFTVFGGEQEWTTVYENGGFVVGAMVPEPSTYAAILGALALAFAACRKRR